MEVMLDKKQTRAIFLFKFKMGQLTTHNNAFGLGTAKERIVQCWYKKFYKGDESLEDEECSGQPVEVDSDQLRAIIEAGPLATTQEVAPKLNTDHFMVI